MPAAASAKPTALARRAGARVAPRPSSVRASLPRHTRAYAASGESFSPGEMHPLGAFEVVSADADVPSADMIVVSMCEADAEKLAADDAVFESLAPGLAAVVKEMADDAEFKGKPGSSAFARVAGFPFKHVGVVGIGAASDVVPETWIGLGSEASAAARKAKCATVAVRKYWMEDEPEDFAAKAESIALGAYLGAFEDKRFKSEPEKDTLERVTVVAPAGADVAASLAAAKASAAGVALTRQLVAAPPNVVTPTGLAEVAAAIAAEFPETMSLRVLEKSECEAAGMGSFLGVAEASDEPAKFIHLTYNIKAGPGSMIEMMKFDMGGAGATLGAARVVAETAPAGVQAHFIVASCENMIGSRGLRPGDILTASNGKTIEVNNTDAEGRLTLADALVYAEKTAGAEAVVDVATLTGAIIVGLGPEVAGMFTPDDDLAASIDEASKAAGESFWRMPMQESYWASCGMKSEFADMKNTGSRGGGAITAALLKRFIEKEETKWAHLDIAGPVWDDKKGGATGFGANTLARWIAGQGK